MSGSIRRKIEICEPVQMAVDFLENMLALSREEDMDEEFWQSLLREKNREIREDYCALAPSLSFMYHGLAYSEGIESGRMLVMRILLGILPSHQPSVFNHGHLNVDKKTIEEVLKYLKSLQMAREGDSAQWRSAVLYSLRHLFKKGFTACCLSRRGWPPLAAAPPYREQTAACYLFNPHTIILYSHGELSPARRSYLFLHEVGHLIFRKYFAGGQIPLCLTQLILKLESSPYFGKLLCPGTQGVEEIFSNLFTMAILMETSTGQLLFGEYYRKMGQTSHLLQKTFTPFSLFSSAALLKDVSRSYNREAEHRQAPLPG